MTPRDEALFEIYKATRGDRLAFEGMFAEFDQTPEERAIMEAVRSAMCEESEMTIDDIDDVGRLTSGLKDNAKDICDLWMQRPLRRCEFGNREIDDIRKAVLGLWTILREIEAQKGMDRAA